MLKGSLALLVALLALGAFFLLRPIGSEPQSAAAEGEQVSAPAQDAPVLVRPQEADATRVEPEAPAPPVPEPPRSTARDDPGDAAPAEERGVLTVTVVDAAGASVAGATVRPNVLPSRLPTAGDPREADAASMLALARMSRRMASREATTDASGTAVLVGLPWGQAGATASLEGLAPGHSERVTLSEERPEARVEIVLVPSGHVEGELRDVRGAPVEGARLFIRRQDRGAASGPSRMDHATTDARGTFAFRDLAVGSWVLSTDAMGLAPASVLAQEIEVEVLAGQTTFVSLPQTGGDFVQVSGRVLRNGTPLAGARISASPDDRNSSLARAQGQTDQAGRFELLLERGGAWRFLVFVGPGQGSLAQTVAVPQAPRHEVVLDFSTGSLSGRVLGPEGEAVAGARVMAFERGSRGAPATSRGLGTTTSDAQGGYTLVDLPAGVYQLQAHPVADDASPFWGVGFSGQVALAPGQDLAGVDVRLSVSGAVRGRVLRDGRGVGMAAIELRGRGSRRNARSEADGSYELRGAGEGTCWIRATDGGWTSAWTSAVASAGSTTALDLVLEAGARVRVEADDAEGPVEQAIVSLQSGDEVVALTLFVRDGRGEEDAVPAGTYQVVARRDWRDKDPAKLATTTITVAPGEERIVRLRLP